VKRRRFLLFAIPGLLVAAAVSYGLLARQAPPGQPPLAAMDLAAMQAAFNAAARDTRVILLLSPT
jgi:hypothetical protein